MIRAAVREQLDEHGHADAVLEEVLSPPWTSDWLSEAGAREAARLRHRAARRSRSHPCASSGARSGHVPALRQRRERAAERIRLDALQGALPLQRAAASPSTTSSASDDAEVPCAQGARASAPTARTRSRSPWRCPRRLRAEYRGAPASTSCCARSIEGTEERRTYSLVNAPGEWPLRIAPRVHAHGRMSRYLAEQLRAGDTLEVLPPNGSFTPQEPLEAGATYVAFAAGCGITPVLAIVRTLLERTHAPRHPFLRQHRQRAHHVPRGAAGAQGPAPGPPRAALPHEPRAAGGRAVQRPHRCRARARRSRESCSSRARCASTSCADRGT